MRRYGHSIGPTLSEWTKFLGIPSAVVTTIGALLINNAYNAEAERKELVEKASVEVPEVREADALDLAIDDLNDAQKELTYYFVSKNNYHYPDATDSRAELQEARDKIKIGGFYENQEVETIDDQIKIVSRELLKMDDGQSESVYEPQRNMIEGIQERAEKELEELKKYIPKEIIVKRDSLKSEEEWSGIGGVAGAILGGAALLCYLGLQVFRWRDGDFEIDGF